MEQQIRYTGVFLKKRKNMFQKDVVSLESHTMMVPGLLKKL
jgi:hypothetical protein